MEPHYDTVVGVHSVDCVIDQLHYSEVLPEPYFILGPDRVRIKYFKMNSDFPCVGSHDVK